jgi:subtilisin family serine protease
MATAEPLPAQSLLSSAIPDIALEASWPADITREWALGGSTGEDVGVCVLDSGVDSSHPMVGGSVEQSIVVAPDEEGHPHIEEDDAGDVFGHGTACAGIIRSIAPDCRIASARVLNTENRGSGEIMLMGLHWAIEQGYRIINMSLSTTKRSLTALLYELADDAYFQRTVIVASAHNRAVESYPWRFASVFSVGSHEESDPLTFFSNPKPPVDFFAKGVDLEVAWLEGATISSAGNSFATAHISGVAALILAKHPELTPHELKTVMHLIANNVGGRA